MKLRHIRILLALGGIAFAALIGFYIYVRVFDLKGMSERYDSEVRKSVGYNREIAIPEGATHRYEANWGYTYPTRAITFIATPDDAAAFAQEYEGKPIGELSHDLPRVRDFALPSRAKNERGYWRPEKVNHGVYLDRDNHRAIRLASSGRGWRLLWDQDTGTVFLIEYR